MKDQDILDNAPKGATHIDGEHDFCKYGYYFSYTSQIVGSRSLADIKRIVELEKELSDSQTQGDRALSVRDLRQQAKGVEDFFKSHKPRISMGKSAIWEVDDVLVDEALAALKEQVK